MSNTDHPDKIEFAGDYNLSNIVLVSHAGKAVDFKGMVLELNIYESIYKNAITGSVVVLDTQNIISKLPICGQERLMFKLSTPGAHEDAHIVDATEKTGNPFHVYKLTNRKQNGEGSLSYVLHFASREFLRGIRTRVNKAYDDRVDKIVTQIFADKTGLDSRKKLTVEKTRNSDKVVIPNMRPLNAIAMLAKKALPGTSKKGAGYYFYETTKGYHFRSWESMCVEQGNHTRSAKQIFRYMPMNITDETIDQDKITHDYTSVESYKFVNNFHDVAANTALGTYAHRVTAYNIFDKSFLTTNYNYHLEYGETKHADFQGNQFDDYNRSKFAVTESPVDYDNFTVSDYADAKTSLIPTTRFLHNEDTGNYGIDVKEDGPLHSASIAQRNMVIAGTTLSLVVKGQSFLQSGDKISFQLRSIDEKNKDGLDDPQYAGSYIITKIRHKVTIDDYVMALECVKDSVMSPYGDAETTYSGIAREEGPTILDLNEEDIADGGTRRNGQR